MLGLKVTAQVVEEGKQYSVHGKTVSTDVSTQDTADFVNGIGTLHPDIEDPTLMVRILGHNDHKEVKGRHFEGEALVGYLIANESYIDQATSLPSLERIAQLTPRLLKDLKEKLNLTVNPEQVGLYLLFDWLQGWD